MYRIKTATRNYLYFTLPDRADCPDHIDSPSLVFFVLRYILLQYFLSSLSTILCPLFSVLTRN